MLIFQTLNKLQFLAAEVTELDKMKFDWSAFGDNHGWTISIVGIGVVFTSLIILSFAVLGISYFVSGRKRKRVEAKGEVVATRKDLHIPGEVSAAISMALHLHFQSYHEEESGILTINRIEKPYKPWSSKLYNITQRPER